MGLLHVLCNNPLVVETHSGLSLEPEGWSLIMNLQQNVRICSKNWLQHTAGSSPFFFLFPSWYNEEKVMLIT